MAQESVYSETKSPSKTTVQLFWKTNHLQHVHLGFTNPPERTIFLYLQKVFETDVYTK